MEEALNMQGMLVCGHFAVVGVQIYGGFVPMQHFGNDAHACTWHDKHDMASMTLQLQFEAQLLFL